MFRFGEEPTIMAGTDSEPCPSDTAVKPVRKDEVCPFVAYGFKCEHVDCRDCEQMREAQRKAREDAEIADNTQSFWIESADGAAR